MEMTPGSYREIEIDDLPGEYGSVSDMLVGYYGFNPEEEARLWKFIDDTAMIESSGGKFTKHPETSARGDFQFMTTPGPGQNAFTTGLNRTENLYRKLGGEVPDWVSEAKKHGDPNKLSREHQNDVFLANLWDRKKTDPLFKGIGSGDVDAALNLYGEYHHTAPGPKASEKSIKDYKKAIGNARSVYGQGYKHGGLVRDAYGRKLI